MLTLRKIWTAAAIAVAGVLSFVIIRPTPTQRAQHLPPDGSSGYVTGPRACSGCHAGVARTFAASGMGRSMRKANPSEMPSGFAEGVRFRHELSNRNYTLVRRDDKFFQRRHQIGPGGQEINVLEREIHFVAGSGNHAKTFLHRTPDGRLFELPLTWYAEGGGTWAMNPGFDHSNQPDFRRQIQYECIACHSAYPEIAPGADLSGGDPRFPGEIPEGIDCQRCHGPGKRHIETAQSGDFQKARAAIVNPARLSPARKLEVCMQCHLETTSSRLPHSIVRWDRGAFSYRPGEPLEAHTLHFDHAKGSGRDDKFEIASQAYRLRKSQCFLMSAGNLTCTTCHDPHAKAERVRAIQACQGCHGTKLAARPAHPKDPDCVRCHMQSRRTEDVVHVVMTDHFIQRRPSGGALLAARHERPDTTEMAYKGEVVAYYPSTLAANAEDALYLAVAQVKQFSNLAAGMPALAALLARMPDAPAPAHFELAEAYDHTGDSSRALSQYEICLKKAPKFRPALLGYARTLAQSKRLEPAAQVLNELISRDSTDSVAHNSLGLVRVQQGKPDEAVSAFRKATEFQPDYAEAYSNLGSTLAQLGDRNGAIQAFQEAIRLDPGFATAHLGIARVIDRPAESEFHIRAALFYQPKNAAVHFELGSSLAAQERFSEAAGAFEAAAAADPAMGEAHAAAADMLVLLGRTAEARVRYHRALDVKPSLGSARKGLEALR